MSTAAVPANPSVLESLNAQDLLRWAGETYGERFSICTSFQREGLVLIDMAVKMMPRTRVFTLDTGRLPSETYEVIEAVRKQYGVVVEMVYPDAAEVGAMASMLGPNLFYDGVANRKLCCQIRKVRPLDRKLAEFDAYAVGLRREQSEERGDTAKAQLSRGKWKLAPLADWSRAEVNAYIEANGVPRHPLEARGYPSIGCAPCTRAVAEGEAERAGRWWWELDGGKECGLHVTPEGAVKRELDVLLEDVLAKSRW